MTEPNQSWLHTPRSRPARVGLGIAAGLLTLSALAVAVGSVGEHSRDDSSAPTQSAGAADMSSGAAQESSPMAEEAYSDSGGQRPRQASNALDVPLADRAVIRTGSISLSSDDVAATRSEVLGVVEALGGYVADEQSRADDEGGLRASDLTLQVPTDELDTAMERTSAAGTVTERSQSAKDVTEQVVDVGSRVESATASLRRIRLLLGEATSLGDVIRLENELGQRQADLESLQAQQQSLASRTQLATLRVSIGVPREPWAEPDDEEEATGFLAGLERGWDALSSGYVTLATVLGTVLPTLLVLGVLALLGRWLVRRFRGPRVTTGAV